MSNIKLFESVEIRSVYNESDQKWYFAVVDVIEVLTNSVNPKDYIKKMRKRDTELNSYWGTICPLLEMETKDGKKRKIQVANAEGLLRIIYLKMNKKCLKNQTKLTMINKMVVP